MRHLDPVATGQAARDNANLEAGRGEGLRLLGHARVSGRLEVTENFGALFDAGHMYQLISGSRSVWIVRKAAIERSEASYGLLIRANKSPDQTTLLTYTLGQSLRITPASNPNRYT